jgi:hypothetical protein
VVIADTVVADMFITEAVIADIVPGRDPSISESRCPRLSSAVADAVACVADAVVAGVTAGPVIPVGSVGFTPDLRLIYA